MMLAADYSQIELRIMAHLSGDEGLLRAFAAGVEAGRDFRAGRMQYVTNCPTVSTSLDSLAPAVVATPHFIPGTAWSADSRVIAERVAAVQARLDAELRDPDV